MSNLERHFWRPDPSDIVRKEERTRNRSNARRLKRKAAKDKQKKIKSDNAEAREFCIKYLGLNKYATNLAIVYAICQKYEKPVPSKDKIIKKVMVDFWRYKKGELPRAKVKYMTADEFYSSKKWIELRYIALSTYGATCCLCGASAKDGVQIHVDHIEPRSRKPKLQYSLDNLQILCSDCNMGKSNYDSIDWRNLPNEQAEE